MILGLSTSAFTLFHVILSLMGIASGVIAVLAMIANKWHGALTTLFLGTTLATSATGFLFHSPKFGPPHIIGLISLAVLAAALFALYVRHLAGSWRTIYIVCAVFALYLNSFVGVVQAFQKIPAIHELAPTQSEPPFKIAQGLLLIAFVIAGYLSVKRFHPRTR